MPEDKLKQLGALKNGLRMTEDEFDKGLMALTAFMEQNPVQTKVSFWSRVTRPLSYGVSAFMILVVAGGGVSYASVNTLPGDALYEFKIGVVEEVQSAFQFTPQAKAEFEVARAEKRLKEANVLAEAGNLDEEKEAIVMSKLSKHVAEVEAFANKLGDEGADVLVEWNEVMVENREIVAQLVTPKPQESKPALIPESKEDEPIETREHSPELIGDESVDDFKEENGEAVGEAVGASSPIIGVEEPPSPLSGGTVIEDLPVVEGDIIVGSAPLDEDLVLIESGLIFTIPEPVLEVKEELPVVEEVESPVEIETPVDPVVELPVLNPVLEVTPTVVEEEKKEEPIEEPVKEGVVLPEDPALILEPSVVVEPVVVEEPSIIMEPVVIDTVLIEEPVVIEPVVVEPVITPTPSITPVKLDLNGASL